MNYALRGFVACFFSLSILILPFALPPIAFYWALYGVAVFAHLQYADRIYRWAEGGAR